MSQKQSKPSRRERLLVQRPLSSPGMGKIQKAINASIEHIMPVRSVKASGPARRAKNGVVEKSSEQAAPVAFGLRRQNKSPNYQGLKDGVRIKHCEFVADLVTSNPVLPEQVGAFSITKFLLNPANVQTFPWLSTMAQGYAEFIPHSIKFKFKTNAPTSSGGMVCMATTPDVTDNTPASKVELMNYENSTRSALWQDSVHIVDKDVLKRLPIYLTSSVPLTSTDTTRQLGSFFVASAGGSAGLDYGELYIEYDISLKHPQTHTGVGATISMGPNTISDNNNRLLLTNAPIGNMRFSNLNPSNAASNAYLQSYNGGPKLVTVSFTLSQALGVSTFHAALIPPVTFCDDKSSQLPTSSVTTLFQMVDLFETSAVITYYVNAPQPFLINIPSFIPYITGLTTNTYTTNITISDWFRYNDPITSMDPVEKLRERLDKLDQQLNHPTPQCSDDEHIVTEDVVRELSSSYLMRIGDALGVKKPGHSQL